MPYGKQVSAHGVVQMLIHLGKHYLGQRDHVDQTIATPGGSGLKIEIVRVKSPNRVEEAEATGEQQLPSLN